MKFGIIVETCKPEKAWNAVRFGVTSLKMGHQVKIFLMGEAVECPEINEENYNVRAQLDAFISSGGELLACGTCLKSRKINPSEVCPASTMADCVNMVVWADKTLTF